MPVCLTWGHPPLHLFDLTSLHVLKDVAETRVDRAVPS